METVGIIGVVLGLVAALGAAVRAWLHQRARNNLRAGAEQQRRAQAKQAQAVETVIKSKERQARVRAAAKVEAVRVETAQREAAIRAEAQRALEKPVDDEYLGQLLEQARKARGDL